MFTTGIHTNYTSLTIKSSSALLLILFTDPRTGNPVGPGGKFLGRFLQVYIPQRNKPVAATQAMTYVSK